MAAGLAGLAVAEERPAVDVSLTGDADGQLLAVSGTGNATASGGCPYKKPYPIFTVCGGIAAAGTGRSDASTGSPSAFGPNLILDAVAVSVTGDANGTRAVSVFGNSTGGSPVSLSGQCGERECVSVNGTGPADAHWLAISVANDSDAGVISVSGTGDARGGYAASITGDAEGWATGATGTGASRGSPAVAVAGDASCNRARYPCVAVSVLGDAEGHTTISGTGDSRPDEDSHPEDGHHSYGVLGTCDGTKCNNVSGDGPARAQFIAVSPTGDADGWIAVSGTGNATCDADQRAMGAPCVSASGMGDANDRYDCFSRCTGAISASGTGNASGGIAASATGDAQGATRCVSLSFDVILLCPDTALSISGDASGRNAYSVVGQCNGEACRRADSNGARSGDVVANLSDAERYGCREFVYLGACGSVAASALGSAKARGCEPWQYLGACYNGAISLADSAASTGCALAMLALCANTALGSSNATADGCSFVWIGACANGAIGATGGADASGCDTLANAAPVQTVPLMAARGSYCINLAAAGMGPANATGCHRVTGACVNGALSVSGDATSKGCDERMWSQSLLVHHEVFDSLCFLAAISGTGNATSGDCLSGEDVHGRCASVAVAGLGSARAEHVAVALDGDADAEWVAVSGTGDARGGVVAVGVCDAAGGVDGGTACGG